MRDNAYRLNVFEKADSSQKRNGEGERNLGDLSPTTRLFLSRMQTLASNDLVDLKLQVHKWPTPQRLFEQVGDSPVVTPVEDETRRFAYLDSPNYDADFAVCFGRTLHDFGPEVGHLLHGRRNSVHHILLVTEQPISSEWDETMESFHPVARNSFRPKGSIIYQPYIDKGTDGSEHISFFDIPSTYSDDTADRIQHILCC